MPCDRCGAKSGSVIVSGRSFCSALCVALNYYSRGLREADLFWPKPHMPRPPEEQFERWRNGETCEATDGCPVAVDGWCLHGYPSWLIYEG
ncbi:MAG: hypothetical protein GTO22_14430 [Gemmatimonadales bacterium]|nr:hypothetical protein [Gemmatimonadales bacterium]